MDAQRGNPHGIRAKASDHAVRRYAERALGMWVDGDDAQAIATLRKRNVNIGAIRRRISIAGGLGVANQASAIISDGLKLVIVGDTVVTVLAKRTHPSAQGEAEPAPKRRPRTVLDVDYGRDD